MDYNDFVPIWKQVVKKSVLHLQSKQSYNVFPHLDTFTSETEECCGLDFLHIVYILLDGCCISNIQYFCNYTCKIIRYGIKWIGEGDW